MSKGGLVRIHIRLTKEMLADIREQSKLLGLSESQMIRTYLMRGMYGKGIETLQKSKTKKG